jgi:hypothetical protein
MNRFQSVLDYLEAHRGRQKSWRQRLGRLNKIIPMILAKIGLNDKYK